MKGKKGDNDFQIPDITNPEVPGNPEPGDGTHQPDIENPPVPPFIPDFE